MADLKYNKNTFDKSLSNKNIGGLSLNVPWNTSIQITSKSRGKLNKNWAFALIGYFLMHLVWIFVIYWAYPGLIDFSSYYTWMLWVLIVVTFWIYGCLSCSAPGYVEANLIIIDNLESFHQDSGPNITNFSK